MQLTIVYIMSYGRSGATFLDIILGNHPEIESLGEVALFHQHSYQGGFCSCSKSFADCSFWSSVSQKYVTASSPYTAKDFTMLIHDVEGIFALPSLFFGLLPSQKIDDYRQCMCTFFRAVFERSGKKIFVDSSKSARACIGRVVAMKKICNFNLKLIHLFYKVFFLFFIWPVSKLFGLDYSIKPVKVDLELPKNIPCIKDSAREGQTH